MRDMLVEWLSGISGNADSVMLYESGEDFHVVVKNPGGEWLMHEVEIIDYFDRNTEFDVVFHASFSGEAEKIWESRSN